MFDDKAPGNLFSGENPAQGEPTQDWVTAYCDGGSRGNPGPAGYGVFIEGPKGEKLAELSEFLGKTTNNVAEYSALLGALEWALQSTHRRLRVVGDSELLVKQIQGRYKVASPDLRPLYEEAKRRIAKLDAFRIEHVLRGKNQRADRLANAAMDRGMGRGMGRTAAGPPTGAPHPKSPAPDSGKPWKPEPAKILKGYVKGGVVHLLEGELPDGVFVRITPDRQ